MASPPSLSRIGQKLRHYQLLELIGSGGMGEVYRAHDEHLDRDVAVKVLAEDALADDAARARFRHEALALSRLDHPCVATVYDFDTETVDFLVTEYVSGSRLEEKVRTGPLPEKEILELGMQLAEGVAAAHDRGVVHRDLKPSNLRLTSDGRLKILDFGLAVFPEPLSDASTASFDESDHDVSGTVQYMSPEQLRGDPIDTRADIYGIGAVLYELAAGLPPFARTTLAGIFDGALHERPKPPRESNPDISDHLQQIILRCLEKQRDHRYQTARDLLADLRRAVICAGDERAVAVLYFENLGQATDGEYFRDGITEDITTELTKIKDLRVFSRSAVLQFRDKPVSATSVGQQLNAAYLVEGSVRRDGERLRITAKLVETRTGLTRWAERYDRDLKDVFAIQDEIAQNIARELRLVLSDNEKSALRKVPTGNVRAYDFYLRGRHFLHQFRRKGLVLASEMFQKAIAIDPQYARAFAGLADCASFVYMYWESSQDYLEKADYASSKALQLDPDLAEAHASCGLAASLRKDYDKAQRGFDAAIRINPKLYEPYYFAGRTCYAQGKLEEAVRWFDQASRVNPEDYQSRMLMGSALHGLKRFAEAKPTFENAVLAVERHLDVYPDDSRALYFGAIGLTQLEQRERAIEWARRATELEPDEKLVLYNIACVYALLGELDSAIACLERSITLGWDLITWMTHDPDLANLRNHPRFIALTGVSARP